MTGNVAEWCWDWFSDDFPTSCINPIGPQTGNNKVLRGGDGISGMTESYSITSRAEAHLFYGDGTGIRLVLNKK